MRARAGIDQTRHAGTFVDVERMRAASVLVGGVGALGNEAVKNLAMMSVGRLVLVDLDTIEEHNLSRSVFFFFGDAERAREERIGKARFVADMVREHNPDVEVAAIHGDVADLGAGFYRRFDAAVSCFDGAFPRYVMNGRCAEAGVPFVNGGLGNTYRECTRAYVQVSDPSQGTACFGCKLSPRERAALEARVRADRFGCAQAEADIREAGGVPTTVMMASVVGALEALETAKLLSRRTDQFAPRVGTLVRMDFSNLADVRMSSDELPIAPGCPHHRYQPSETLDLPFRSDRATLHEVWSACVELAADPGLRLRLPGRHYPVARCIACGTEFPWIPAAQPVVGRAYLAADRDLPAGARLPCGCPRGLASLAGPPPTEFYGSAEFPEATLTLRQMALPWMSMLPIVTEDGTPYGHAAVAAEDFAVLMGWTG